MVGTVLGITPTETQTFWGPGELPAQPGFDVVAVVVKLGFGPDGGISYRKPSLNLSETQGPAFCVSPLPVCSSNIPAPTSQSSLLEPSVLPVSFLVVRASLHIVWVLSTSRTHSAHAH